MHSWYRTTCHSHWLICWQIRVQLENWKKLKSFSPLTPWNFQSHATTERIWYQKIKRKEKKPKTLEQDTSWVVLLRVELSCRCWFCSQTEINPVRILGQKSKILEAWCWFWSWVGSTTRVWGWLARLSSYGSLLQRLLRFGFIHTPLFPFLFEVLILFLYVFKVWFLTSVV